MSDLTLQLLATWLENDLERKLGGSCTMLECKTIDDKRKQATFHLGGPEGPEFLITIEELV